MRKKMVGMNRAEGNAVEVVDFFTRRFWGEFVWNVKWD